MLLLRQLAFAGLLFDGPFQTIRMRRSEPGERPARYDGQYGKRHHDLLQRNLRTQRTGYGGALENLRPGGADIIDDTGGYKPLHDADSQVYRLHHQNKGPVVCVLTGHGLKDISIKKL